MSREILIHQRRLWSEKPVLRAIYEDYYFRMVKYCKPGLTLEIGGGSGNLKNFLDNVISTDIIPSPWLDAAADAQKLPFIDKGFSNVLGVDILHHLEQPILFFREAERVLCPGGRIVLLEPGISTISSFIYRYMHPEPVDMKADPFQELEHNPLRHPFDANQAMPTLLFKQKTQRFEATFPNFKILSIQWLSFLSYPLSGGFRSWALIPVSWVSFLLKMEENLPNFLGKFFGFRLLIILSYDPPNQAYR
jgi:SAM-dependent methyltransferase